MRRNVHVFSSPHQQCCLVDISTPFIVKIPVRWRVDEDLFLFYRLLFCLIGGIHCLTETFQFHGVPFINFGISA